MVRLTKEVMGIDGKKRTLIIDGDTDTIFYSGFASDFRKNKEVKKAILDFENEKDNKEK